MTEEDETGYVYQLIEFETKTKKGQADIDCVPSSWIGFNITRGKCECKFLPPPYSEENCNLLHSLVEERAPPPESWPSYPIILQGHARNYEEAMKRLELLKNDSFAYTTEDDILPKEKAQNIAKSFRQKSIKGDEQLTKDLMKVPTIPESSVEDSTYTDESSSSVTSSTDENSNTVQRKTTKLKIKAHNGIRVNKNSNPRCNKSTTKAINLKPANKTGRPSVRSCEVYPKEVSDDPSSSYYSSMPHTPGMLSKAQKTSTTPSRSISQPPVKKLIESFIKPRSDRCKEMNMVPMQPNETGSITKLPLNILTPPLDITDKATCSVRKLQEEAAVDKKKIAEPSIQSVLNSFRRDIQYLTAALHELKGVVERSALAKDAFGSEVQSFASENNVSLPLKNMVEFRTFEDRLQNQKFRQDFTSTLHYNVDAKLTMSKNITSVLKKHLSRDLAMKFTAVKISGSKAIFKGTLMCKCLLDVIMLTSNKGGQGPATETLFYQELGNVISNAVDWDGHRKSRIKTPRPLTEIS